MNSKKQVNIAIIGCGSWGKNFVHTINDTASCHCRYIISKNPNNQQFESDFTTILSDYKQLLNQSDVDGAIIATPAHTHFDIAMDLLNNNIPIIIEKPMTLTDTTATILYKKAKSMHIPVIVNHTHLFNPVFRELKQFSKHYGSIKHIRTCFGKWMPHQPHTSLLWELASHDIAMCTYILEQTPSHIESQEITMPQQHHYSQSYQLKLDFNTLNCEITLSNSLPQKTREFHIETDSHHLIFQDYTKTPLQIISKQDGSYQKNLSISDQQRPLTVLVDEFSKAIQTKDSNPYHIKLGKNVTKLISSISTR